MEDGADDLPSPRSVAAISPADDHDDPVVGLDGGKSSGKDQQRSGEAKSRRGNRRDQPYAPALGRPRRCLPPALEADRPAHSGMVDSNPVRHGSSLNAALPAGEPAVLEAVPRRRQRCVPGRPSAARSPSSRPSRGTGTRRAGRPLIWDRGGLSSPTSRQRAIWRTSRTVSARSVASWLVWNRRLDARRERRDADVEPAVQPGMPAPYGVERAGDQPEPGQRLEVEVEVPLPVDTGAEGVAVRPVISTRLQRTERLNLDRPRSSHVTGPRMTGLPWRSTTGCSSTRRPPADACRLAADGRATAG